MAGVSVYPADWSEDQKTPAFMVDAALSQLVAANAAARALFAIDDNARLPLPLDSAMPALAKLRTLARTPEAQREVLRLTFWVNGAVKPLECDVRPVANGESGKALYAVTVSDKREAATSAKSTSAAKPPAIEIVEAPKQAELDSPSPPKRDDHETLKEIARQIRETEHVWGVAARENSGDKTRIEPAPLLAANEEKKHGRDGTAQPAPIALSHDTPPKSTPRASQSGQAHVDLAKLAHELKTPLSAIAAASEVMRDERLGPMGSSRYRDYAGDIHTSAAHAIDVINAMLGGRGAANGTADVRNIDLNALVAETVSSMQPLAGERDLDLGFDGEASNPILLTDKTALKQILINLLTNALKYTPEGGVVRVATGYLDDGAIFLVVRDTGLGFPANANTDDDGLAAPPHKSYGRLQGSYGLGLPLVKQLAARLGAEVEIDSKLGKGTVVLVAFPGFASVG